MFFILTAPSSLTIKSLSLKPPARRNFLKSNKVELKYIIDEFIRIAISNPNINFILLNNGLEIYNLKSSTLSKRIISLFKKSYEQQLVLCDEKFGNIFFPTHSSVYCKKAPNS